MKKPKGTLFIQPEIKKQMCSPKMISDPNACKNFFGQTLRTKPTHPFQHQP